MATIQALTDIRPITVTLTGGPYPIDAYKAVGKTLEDLETQYLNSLDQAGVPQGLTNLATADTLITGSTPFRVHRYEITNDWVAGTYTFNYIETVANADEVS